MKQIEYVMILGTLIVLLLAFVLWVFLTPMRVTVDSEQQHINIRIWGLGSFSVIWEIDHLLLRLRIFGFRKSWTPKFLKPRKRKHGNSGSKKGHSAWSVDRVRKLLKSISINELTMDLDTDNYVLNGYLYPLFSILNKPGRDLHINYTGRFYLHAQAETRGYKLLRAMLL